MAFTVSGRQSHIKGNNPAEDERGERVFRFNHPSVGAHLATGFSYTCAPETFSTLTDADNTGGLHTDLYSITALHARGGFKLCVC